MFENTRITHRIIVVMVAYSIAIFGVIGMSLWGLMSARDSLKNVFDNAMKPAMLVNESIEKITQNRMQVLLAFQHAPESSVVSIHTHPISVHLDAIRDNRKIANDIFDFIEKGAITHEEKALLESAKIARQNWRVKLDQATDAIKSGNFSPVMMASFLAAGREEGVAASNALIKFKEYKIKQAEDEYKMAENRYHYAQFIALGGLFLVAVLVSVSLMTTRSLLKQLGGEPAYANDITKRIAAGDLSGEIVLKSNDQSSLLHAMKQMRDSLANIVVNVRQGSMNVSLASEEIATGNRDLSVRTESQASALEQTSASIEELSSTVKQSSDHARQANQLARSASSVAIKGGEIVAQVVDTMKHINDSSKRINDIISVIDGIAFQTNILALNAAVEAARASEQGRGFAVVASEVRSLAGRSAEAAKEIKTLINASVERVEQGSALVDQAGITMTEVVSSIKRVADLMGEIDASSNEQSLGVDQVCQAITQIDQVTQQNAALVEEMDAASNSLNSQAHELVQTVAAFNLGIEGDQRIA